MSREAEAILRQVRRPAAKEEELEAYRRWLRMRHRLAMLRGFSYRRPEPTIDLMEYLIASLGQ